ncbi:MAG: DUF3467 domain-containing protein [Gemmatimonadota bacterium]
MPQDGDNARPAANTTGGPEFIIDWLMTAPNGSALVSRIIVSPGHFKRVLAALADNLRKYEHQFGEIAPAGALDPGQQNFH